MKRGLIVPCVLALLAAATAVHAADEEAQLKKNTQSLQQLRGRIEALDRDLARNRGRRDELQQEIESAEQRLQQLNRQLQSQRERTAAQTSQLRKTRAERTALEQKLAAQKDLLGRQIRAAYLIGRRGSAKLLLRQDDTARLQRLLTGYDYLNRARTEAIGDIRAQGEALREIEARQEQETAQLNAALAQQEQMLAQLASVRVQRAETVRKLRDKIAGGESELDQLRAGERELTTLITRLRDLLADIPGGFRPNQPLARQKGRLPWPLRGKLLARFGAAKAGGKLKWNGLWIAASEGAPVRAVANGRVAYVGHMQRFGLLAVVEHGDGYYTLYGHNAEVSKNPGDKVRAGDVLGRAGSSGGHEESGLYFELRKGSQPVNPLDWLTR
jgi:septal ring factor EnvC (AmiA/AmiB activator)